MEQYRSGHNEADSKSVSPSGPVGSNPTCSAKKSILAGCFFIYMKKGSLQRSPTKKTEKPVRGVQPMNQASAPWPSHMRGCCSDLGRSGKPWEGPFMCRLRANFSRLAYPMQDTHIRERKVLQPSSLLLFCLLFFGTALSSVYHRPILEEGRCEKMEFPDVSSFLCPSPYRGCGGGHLEIGFIIS